jgi:Putative transmembrane protein (PGPGW).
MKKVKRILVTVAGVTVLAVGIALVVLPGPAFLVIPAGMAILAIEFAWAKRWLRSTKDFAKRSARFISGNPGNVNGGPTPEMTSITRLQLLPERILQSRAAKEDRSSISPVIEPTLVEAEALSRFEGEGGREAPDDGWVDVPLDQGVWRRPSGLTKSKNEST